jgi:hypothetical protein
MRRHVRQLCGYDRTLTFIQVPAMEIFGQHEEVRIIAFEWHEARLAIRLKAGAISIAPVEDPPFILHDRLEQPVDLDVGNESIKKRRPREAGTGQRSDESDR